MHSRCGWFSERSAHYLASGRPVITQDTGFGSVLPVGKGLLSFHDLETALAAIDTLNEQYEDHCEAARSIAAEYFDSDRVLEKLLDDAGV